MTQAKVVGTGTNVFGLSSTQIPTEITVPDIERVGNRMDDRVKKYTQFLTDFGDGVMTFVAPDKGRIAGIRFKNGLVACDGTHGWELDFTNASNSSARLAYFGFGSGTEAAKATDKVTVAASAFVDLPNSITASTAFFNTNDIITVTADRDGSSVGGAASIEGSLGGTGGMWEVILDLSDQGR